MGRYLGRPRRLTAGCEKTNAGCCDQKPHLQALSRRHPVDPPIPGFPGRRDHDYSRHGTTCLHALLDVRSGRCRHACRDGHTSETTGELLETWLRERPEPAVIVIADNPGANHAAPVKEALERCGKAVEVRRLPTSSANCWTARQRARSTTSSAS